MAKIIQFDPSRKASPKYYTPEALRGRLLQFKFRTASDEPANIAPVSDAPQPGALAGHNPTNIKTS